MIELLQRCRSFRASGGDTRKGGVEITACMVMGGGHARVGD